MPPVAQGAAVSLTDRLRQQGRRLLYATVIWNAVEGATALASGLIAGSVVLTAFGLDSSIEVFASAVAIWHLGRPTTRRTRLGLRLIGASFLVVALYVAVEAVRRLESGEHARLSILGFLITSAAVPIMVGRGLMKGRVASTAADAVLWAEATFSFVDAGLSATVLLGLALDQGLGLWWADPSIALVVAAIAARGARGCAGCVLTRPSTVAHRLRVEVATGLTGAVDVSQNLETVSSGTQSIPKGWRPAPA